MTTTIRERVIETWLLSEQGAINIAWDPETDDENESWSMRIGPCSVCNNHTKRVCLLRGDDDTEVTECLFECLSCGHELGNCMPMVGFVRAVEKMYPPERPTNATIVKGLKQQLDETKTKRRRELTEMRDRIDEMLKQE